MHIHEAKKTKNSCVQVSLPTLILGPTLKMFLKNDFFCIKMTYRAQQTLENHHKNDYHADHFYHFQITATGSMSESIDMCKIVYFHGF